MQREPYRKWLAKDFQNGDRFIGYEAGPRLCDLCDDGLVRRAGREGRFMQYELTNDGIDTVFGANGEVVVPEVSTPVADHTPIYKHLTFGSPMLFDKWRAETATILVDFRDNGQDLLRIWIAGNGEIIDCNLQAWVWNGKFVKLDELVTGQGIQLWRDGEYTLMDFIVEKITYLKK